MLFFKKHVLIAIAGGIWFFIGLLLLVKGFYLLLVVSQMAEGASLTRLLLGSFSEKAALAIASFLGLFLGVLKGYFVLGKSARRTQKRLESMQGLIHFSKLYRLQDYLLVSAMIAFGRLLQWMQCSSDLRGMLNMTIGSALLTGAVIYFRLAGKEKAVRS